MNYIGLKSFLAIILTINFYVLVSLASDKSKPIYKEELVPKYELPPLLISQKVEIIKTVQQWKTIRRPEILKLFQENVYGVQPGTPSHLSFQVEEDEIVFKSKAIKRRVKIFLTDKKDGPVFNLRLYIPKKSKKEVPVFLGLNFGGNKAMDHWPVEAILDRGYALATMHYKEVAPDSAKDFNKERGSLYPELQNRNDNFSAIGAWAWGLSRALDYLETDKSINSRQVIVFGHSRLGKAALWAGATDERFALIISNNSGEGGAALAKRHFGETTKMINEQFPHWFCKNFKRYNDKEDELPIDQHMLIALMAPRPVYIASAKEDLWADPYGEFLSAKEASQVYKLFGLVGLSAKDFPATNTVSHGEIGYHLREGKHAITDYDWKQYLLFADKHFRPIQ